MSRGKNMNNISYNKNELFFIQMCREKLHIKCQYLSLPNEICFTFCLNEAIYLLKLNIDNPKINHLVLLEDFLTFMINDVVLKSIDESEYYNLLDYLNRLNGGSIVIKEVYSYLIFIRSLYKNKYLNTIYAKVIESFEKDNLDNDALYGLYSSFINEIIFNKCCYRCLINLFDDFQTKNKYINLNEFLKYIWEENDSIEILLPLKNTDKKEINYFIDNELNQVVELNNKYYLKIYNNQNIDYVTLFERQKIRIDSYFNFLKYYGTSKIEFDLDENIYIKRNTMNDEIQIKLREILTYNPYFVKDEMRDYSLVSMRKLYENKNFELYCKINDIFSYAERDNDILSSASFVDSWISLESLIKLSGIKTGFEGVQFYIPKMLSLDFFRKNLNTLLKATYKQYLIENFVKEVLDGSIRESKVKNEYLKWKIRKYIGIINNSCLIDQELKRIESEIEKDLRRLYIIRNEYVHSSSNDVWNNIAKIKMKHILAFSIDVLMKTLNNNIKAENYNVNGVWLFSDIIKNYNNRVNVLRVMSGKFKIDGKTVGRKDFEPSLSLHEIIINIILNKRNSLNIFHGEQYNESK